MGEVFLIYACKQALIHPFNKSQRSTPPKNLDSRDDCDLGLFQALALQLQTGDKILSVPLPASNPEDE